MSVALGIARGSLDDIVDLAVNKTPLLASASLAANPTFQLDLAVVDTDLRAARRVALRDGGDDVAIARDEQHFTLEA